MATATVDRPRNPETTFDVPAEMVERVVIANASKRPLVLMMLILCAATSARAQARDFLQLAKTGAAADIQAAIDKGAAVDSRDQFGDTPLMMAAFGNPDPDVITMFLRAGADTRARNTLGWTALMWAAHQNPNSQVTARLLEAGSDVAARDWTGDTVLMLAASNRNADVTALLLDTGADVKARGSLQSTALMHASSSNPNPAVVTKLLGKGAGINDADETGRTPLMFAAASNVPEVVIALLAAGADGTMKDKDGRTAFDHAQGNAGVKASDAYWKLNEAQY